MAKKLHFINIVPVFRDVDFAVSEILRQHRDVKLDCFALSFSYHPTGYPARKKIDQLTAAFRHIRAALEGTDIELGVLIQSTQGHGWSGKVPMTDETWQRSVELGDKKSQRMCHLDPDFVAYIREACAETVRAGAAFLLVDDDFGLRRNECFCPLHMAEYNRALGANYTKAELEEIINTRPIEDPVIQTVMQIRRKTVLDFAGEIRAAIDSVDPDCRCGLCAPSLGYGFVSDAAHILAGKTEPFIRINNAIYGNQHRNTFFGKLYNTYIVKYQISGVSDLIAESDTFPQNYYSVGANMFHAHIVNGILCGLNGSKLWVSEFNQPVDTGSQARYEAKLRDNMAFYEKLAETVDGIRWQGVASPMFHPPAALHPYLAGEPSMPYRCWNLQVFSPFAFPVFYTAPETDLIQTLTSAEIPLLKDEEIRSMFSGKLLIDGRAAKILTERGYGPLMGVTASDGGDDFHFSTEFDPETNLTAWCQWDPELAKLDPINDQVQVLTMFAQGNPRFDELKPVAPAVTFFTNELGGRIAVAGWHTDMEFFKILHPARRQWLKKILDVLNGSTFEMSVEDADQQTLVRHGILADKRELLVVQNLSVDILDHTDVRLVRTPAYVEELTLDGTWKEIPFRRINDSIVQLDRAPAVCEQIIFRFTF